MGDCLIGVVGGLHISHFVSTLSVKGYSAKEGKNLHGASGLGLGCRRNHLVKRTEIQIETTPFLFLFMEVWERVIGRRKSNPLICKYLLVLGLLGSDGNRHLTNHLGHQIYGSCLLVKT